MRVRKNQKHVRKATISGVKVTVSVRTCQFVVTPTVHTTAADRNAVTAWVMEQLESVGWTVPDPIDLHRTIWG